MGARNIDNRARVGQYYENGCNRPTPNMKINPQDWQRLFKVLDTMKESEREAWLSQLDSGGEELKAKLSEMMAQRDRTPPIPGQPSVQSPSPTMDAPTMARPRRQTPAAAVANGRNRADSLPTKPAGDGGLPADSDTDRRWDSPHTWTGVLEEPVGVGTVLNGRYVIERELGEGGMGTVFLARDEMEKEPIAIKVLKEDFRLHPDALDALREEVRKSRALAGPNIVGVYELNRDRNTVYVKMEYLQGKSLDALLDEDFARGMPFSQARPIIQGICAGLAYAHERGVIHSDVKPSNIFVTTGNKAKVLDFGISRAIRGPGKRFDPGELGALTPAYASCEMLDRQEPDIWDDVYSLACVIYELLTGKHPYRRLTATKARDDKMRMARVVGLSRSQNAALAKALAFSREERTPSVEALFAGLEDTHGRRMRVLTWICAGVAATVLVGIGGWFARVELQRRSSDNAFVQSLLKTNAERSTDYDPQTVNDLLEQGDDYLKQAQRNFDPGVLSEGVSTAYGAYMSALKLDAANRRAAEGVLAVVRTYRQEAGRLVGEQQFKRALELVAIGLKIDPADRELRALKEELGSRLQSSGNP